MMAHESSPPRCPTQVDRNRSDVRQPSRHLADMPQRPPTEHLLHRDARSSKSAHRDRYRDTAGEHARDDLGRLAASSHGVSSLRQDPTLLPRALVDDHRHVLGIPRVDWLRAAGGDSIVFIFPYIGAHVILLMFPGAVRKLSPRGLWQYYTLVPKSQNETSTQFSANPMISFSRKSTRKDPHVKSGRNLAISVNMLYRDPSAIEVPLCFEAATEKLTFSTTLISVIAVNIFKGAN